MRQCWLLGITFAALCAMQTPQPFQISVDVDLVVLQATFSDKRGEFPPDLLEKDFEVYEDGVKQAIRVFHHDDSPVTVGLVIDHSGSMKSKLAEVVAAAHTFVEASNPQDQMFVVSFNDSVRIPLMRGSPFISAPEELERAILQSPAIGMTKLYDAMLKAQEQMLESKMDKKALIVISDGGDNASRHNIEEVIKNAELSTTLIYTIGIFDEYDTDRNPAVLRRMARATGGEAFFPARLDGTVEICRRIAHDIRNQYTLGYVSTNTARSGAVRKLRVTASAPGRGKLTVRTRSEYRAGPK